MLKSRTLTHDKKVPEQYHRKCVCRYGGYSKCGIK